MISDSQNKWSVIINAILTCIISIVSAVSVSSCIRV